jgi:putative flippase GtrA
MDPLSSLAHGFEDREPQAKAGLRADPRHGDARPPGVETAVRSQHIQVDPGLPFAMDHIARTRFLKFSGIGIVSFSIDVIAFKATVAHLGLSPYAARVVSFVVATSSAWFLNRTFTFHDADNGRPDLQWARFFAANLVGGTVNYAVFVIMIATLPIAAAHPVLALAAGSLSGVFFNFTAYRRYVFRTDAGL